MQNLQNCVLSVRLMSTDIDFDGIYLRRIDISEKFRKLIPYRGYIAIGCAEELIGTRYDVFSFTIMSPDFDRVDLPDWVISRIYEVYNMLSELFYISPKLVDPKLVELTKFIQANGADSVRFEIIKL